MKVSIINSDETLQTAFDIRKKVFVEEQQVPMEIEIDEHEDEAIHFICSDGEEYVGASRLRFVDDYGKLERICVLQEARGKNFGKYLIAAMEEEIIRQNIKEARLNAQTRAVTLYESVGYEVVSGEFMDANIPHVEMMKKLD